MDVPLDNDATVEPESAVADPSFPGLLTQTVDLAAVRHNIGAIKKAARSRKLMAVVKADGYSQGAAEVACAALQGGADQLGVATLRESLDLRESLELRGTSATILAWLWHPDEALDLDAAVASGVQVGVPSAEHLDAVIAAGARANVRPRVTAIADTGLNRSGICVVDGTFARVAADFAEAHLRGEINVTGVASHLACADEPDNSANDMQADRFRRAASELAEAGIAHQLNHLSNSPASLTRPDLSFDMVRPGLAVYGLEPVAGRDHGLRPVMRWEARIPVIKDVAAGEAVSYGRTWVAERDTRTAIIPCGYADGMLRSASGKFDVSINGVRYPQVGRVCMDQFVVDLGPDAPVRTGDVAVIVGTRDGEPTADELAAAAGTINYEILTAPGGRTRRRHVGGRD
ncbi:alanine racemase [uncultured Corynebacterium sp.]|uniref:alanine racemase n=1 Tax=uncultured Corynebacterium sp. TaxID=159447 RepID=UPI0025E54C18|nr:alanine racemase [uncultured Corynebacterium sp.]